MYCAGDGTEHLDVIFVDCKHMVRVVSLGVEVEEFIVVEQGDWKAAGDGAGVHDEPWLVRVVEVAHMRLQNCQGGWIWF